MQYGALPFAFEHLDGGIGCRHSCPAVQRAERRASTVGLPQPFPPLTPSGFLPRFESWSETLHACHGEGKST